MNPARHQRICAEIQEAHKKEIEKMTAELADVKADRDIWHATADADLLKRKAIEAERDALRADAEIGRELIMLVSKKYPNETRADTARRYIMKAEESDSGSDSPKAAIQGEQP